MLIGLANFLFLSSFVFIGVNGLLYPQSNELRSLDSLDGLWSLVREPSTSCADCESIGAKQKWFARDLGKFENATRCPVPTAYNELFSEREWREHVGWVWYQTHYRLPKVHQKSRLVLRFGSVQYRAKVYINAELLADHTGGHLPFEVELPPAYKSNNSYWITVAVDNQLHEESIPPGWTHDFTYKSNNQSHIFVQQKPNFDFFNYAGILRSVQLQILAQVYVKNLQLKVEKPNNLNYALELSSPSNTKFLTKLNDQLKVTLCLLDPNMHLIECVHDKQHFTAIEDVHLWWPRGMGKQPLYTVEVTVYLDDYPIDLYRETFGFRWVQLKDGQIYINDRPFYCHGFGMHEDFYLHGRGFDPVVMTRDLNMFEWLNGNCYRTSHYPYNELRAYEADRRGIAVITEVPAVGIFTYNNKTLQLHSEIITDMIMRDFNHPSIIAWSLANEPVVNGKDECLYYYKTIAQLTRALDPTRPVAVVFGNNQPISDPVLVAENLDLIGINTYPGWYNNLAILETVGDELLAVVEAWHKYHSNKTFILTEYGAEALPGYYAEPSIVFSTQYQINVLERVHISLDSLRSRHILAGEMLWQFADFMTAADVTRPFGNHKGVLTRDRQPKPSAYVMQKRYGELMRENES